MLECMLTKVHFQLRGSHSLLDCLLVFEIRMEFEMIWLLHHSVPMKVFQFGTILGYLLDCMRNSHLLFDRSLVFEMSLSVPQSTFQVHHLGNAI